MAQIRLTKAGQALVARRKLEKKEENCIFRKDEFKVYTLKNTGEKILVNESKIFPVRQEYVMRAV